MAEKTEKPTQKKIKDARKKGEVAKSNEVTTGVQLAAILLFFYFQGHHLMVGMQAIITVTLDSLNLPIKQAVGNILGTFVGFMLHFGVGLALMLIFITLLTLIAQVGPLFSPEAIHPKGEKINPISNFKNIFSMKSLFELFKSCLKVALLSIIFAYILNKYSNSLQFLPLCGLSCGLSITATLCLWLWGCLIAFYVVFGALDFAFQKHTLMKQLKMSKEDIKQEHKDMEGNPEIKQKRKQTHKEIQSGSLADNVKKSSVLIRNPTHLAVCLFYKEGETPLPKVLEKGRGEMALHMVKLAEKHGVPVVENRPLARALMHGVETNHYISENLFEPIAEILRIINNLDYETNSNP
ncbi:EscU/YscU/HrcU family type III secretion system export apparatus switch protein [Vibrio sp. S4M6]|uniref:EscU/YscU/HrcU family type III secretion system export apparatus switch protein n=1 Tax=Vibrio sinus TaxID=2946865 RepID=UPI00202A088C|nr:EscU/YscU/HrcU family type III secretion system export apparatus switch protein [Vibrio sinus]MCL9783718.1 EscU/YscU/HrcU family type III secretion system export apparatus switch protein [Vibrio sinus]